jgi:hypothetical protein
MTTPENSSIDTKSGQGFQCLFLVLMLLMVFLVASRSPVDSDLWWHLRSGQVMAETGKPLTSDVFSYTREGQVWVNHSWLGEVVLYGLYQLGGWAAISAWMGLMAVLAAIFLWLSNSGSAYVKAGFILLASVVCAPLWTPRPQFFSLVFLAFLIWMVNRWLEKGGRFIWLILPVFILWSNLHGGYALGILYLIACGSGLFIDSVLKEGEERKITLRRAGVLLAAAIGGYLAAAVNPNGYRMWLIPFQTVGVDILRQFIQEWSSPDFHSIESWPFALFIVLTIFCLARQSRRTAFRNLMPAILFLLLGLYARRNMAAAAIAGTVVLLDAWNSMPVGVFFTNLIPAEWREWVANYRASQKQLSDRQMKGLNLVLVGLMGFACFVKLAAVTYPGLVSVYEAKYFPADAVAYMQSNAPIHAGRMFNSYNWGGYLIWKNPTEKVYVDGRTDLYGDEILGEWVTVTQAGNGWQEILSKWKVTRIIIEPNRPMVSALPGAGWVEQFRDDQAVVFDLK